MTGITLPAAAVAVFDAVADDVTRALGAPSTRHTTPQAQPGLAFMSALWHINGLGHGFQIRHDGDHLGMLVWAYGGPIGDVEATVRPDHLEDRLRALIVLVIGRQALPDPHPAEVTLSDELWQQILTKADFDDFTVGREITGKYGTYRVDGFDDIESVLTKAHNALDALEHAGPLAKALREIDLYYTGDADNDDLKIQVTVHGLHLMSGLLDVDGFGSTHADADGGPALARAVLEEILAQRMYLIRSLNAHQPLVRTVEPEPEPEPDPVSVEQMAVSVMMDSARDPRGVLISSEISMHHPDISPEARHQMAGEIRDFAATATLTITAPSQP